MSDKALKIAAAICKTFEGFRAHPYLCPANVPTVGIGSTMYPDGRKVKLSDPPVTMEQAEEYLRWELERSMRAALRYCPVLATNDSRLAAVVDFVYNLGPGRLQNSTLRRRINQQDWEEAKKGLMKWVRGGGRVLPGLVKRRQVEAGLM